MLEDSKIRFDAIYVLFKDQIYQIFVSGGNITSRKISSLPSLESRSIFSFLSPFLDYSSIPQFDSELRSLLALTLSTSISSKAFLSPRIAPHTEGQPQTPESSEGSSELGESTDTRTPS
jgi:hypothetical protein